MKEFEPSIVFDPELAFLAAALRARNESHGNIPIAQKTSLAIRYDIPIAESKTYAYNAEAIAEAWAQAEAENLQQLMEGQA